MHTNEHGPFGSDISSDERDRIAFAMDVINTQFASVHDGGRITIERIINDHVRIRLGFDQTQIRPGGTISGPTMFKLADLCVWVGILGLKRDAGIQAVTTNMSINFLKRPQPGDLIGTCHMLKVGRRLAIGNVELTSDADAALVCQATATYAMPPEA